VQDLLAAARYLTIVPLPGGAGASPLGRSAPWFPVVGLAIGGLLVVIDALTARLFPTLLAALLTVTAWKLVTGGLHLDGLADCLDGLAGADAARRLAIMSDSRIGTFGAVGLVLFLLLEVAAVAELPPPARWRALLAAPALARAVPPLLARVFPPARPAGQAAAFRQGLSRGAAPLALGAGVAAAAAVLGAAGLAAAAVACLAGLALGRFLAGRLGGVTGDVLGAALETAELATLLTVTAWTRARP